MSVTFHLDVPASLQTALAEAKARLATLPGLPAAVREVAPRVWVASDFVRRVQSADGVLTAQAADLSRRYSAGELAQRIRQALAAVPDEAGLQKALRQVRHRELARIAFRDLAGWAELDETLGDLSDLADACINGALEILSAWLCEAHGVVRDASGEAQALLVLGMGKLGARELNFSSDVDLIFAYPGGERSDGERPLDAETWFTRLGQRLIRVLDAVTADGFVYRVDMRLRPFGDSGPLVLSFNALETYYQLHGRDWERYAFIKARVVAGDHAAGERLLTALKPFVYRRYLDYGAFEALRDMKRMIADEVARRGMEDNIKLGRGGIREIEFIGQALQLIRGGRETQFQERGILRVLERLGAAGYLQAQDTATLTEAYVFLRQIENRLQMMDDRQSHDLPREARPRTLLAWSMGAADWEAFAGRLATQRNAVQRIFDQLIAPREAAAGKAEWQALWRANPDDAVLRQAGFDPPELAREVLSRLRDGNRQRLMSERARQRLDELMPRVLDASAATDAPALTLQRLAVILEAVMRRSAYFALLLENPAALAQLTRLCAASHWMADMVARQPILLDELIDPRIFQTAPDMAHYGAELDARLQTVPNDDLEALMDALRGFQQGAVVRVAAADIAGILPLMKVSDHLTAIAEHIIQRVLAHAWQDLTARHGIPRNDGAPARFIIVAYGKLGGFELGYGSDLDLVFLHDARGEQQQTNGAAPLDNTRFFLRLAQRIIHLLSTPTNAGVLYEVDTRLRPSGTAGLLVTAFEAFARYQGEEAWTWEHQALLRARPVAGDPALAAQFAALRQAILCRPRPAAALGGEVADMRARMRREQGRLAGADFDLKQDAGGLADLEFLVQYLVLLHAHQHPDLVEYSDIIRLLDGLEIHDLLPAAQARALVDAYRALRGRIHSQALKGAPATAPAEAFHDIRALVCAGWQAVLGPELTDRAGIMAPVPSP